MADKILKIRIQQKYDTVANWRNSSLVLLLGEIALDETNGIKIGDGEHTWNYLPYITDELASQLESSVLLLDNKINDVQENLDSNLQAAFIILDEKIDNTHEDINATIETSYVTLDNKIDSVNREMGANLQSGYTALNNKIDNLQFDVTDIQNQVDQINTDIDYVIHSEIPTTSLVNPSDPNEFVVIDCGTASSDSKD